MWAGSGFFPFPWNIAIRSLSHFWEDWVANGLVWRTQNKWDLQRFLFPLRVNLPHLPLSFSSCNINKDLTIPKSKQLGRGNRGKQTEGQSLCLFLHIFAYFFLPLCFLYMIFSSFHQVGTLSDAVSLHCRDCSTSAVSWMSFCQICEPTAVCICYPFWYAQNISQYSCTDMKDCFP